MVTGAPASTTIGKLDIGFVYEYTPTFSNQLLCNLDYPEAGTATSDLISNLVTLFPSLISMTFDDAY